MTDFDPLYNDHITGTGNVTVTIDSGPGIGSASASGNKITYVPPTPDGLTSDTSLVYKVTNDAGASSTASITIRGSNAGNVTSLENKTVPAADGGEAGVVYLYPYGLSIANNGDANVTISASGNNESITVTIETITAGGNNIDLALSRNGYANLVWSSNIGQRSEDITLDNPCGMITGDIATTGDLTIDAKRDIPDDLSGNDVMVNQEVASPWGGVTGEITATGTVKVSARGDIGKVTAGGDITVSSSEGDIVGAITSTNGNILDVSANGGDILAPAISANGHIVKVYADGSIKNATFTAGGNLATKYTVAPTVHAGDVSAGCDIINSVFNVDGTIGWDFQQIYGMEAGRDFRNVEINAGGGIYQVQAGRDIDSQSSIRASGLFSDDEGIGEVKAGRNIAADITSSSYGVGTISAGRDVGSSAMIDSQGDITKIEAKRSIEAEILSGGNIKEIVAGLNILVTEGIVAAGNIGDTNTVPNTGVTAGGKLSGTIRAKGGGIAFIKVGDEDALDGKINGPTTIHAAEKIGSISVSAQGSYGGHIDGSEGTVVITAGADGDGDGIGYVQASGKIDAKITAVGNIDSIVSGYNNMGGGDIAGAIRSTDGKVGTVKANNGSLLATVTAETDIDTVFATYDIAKDIHAGDSIFDVDAKQGSILGNLTADRVHIGPITVGLDLIGDVTAKADYVDPVESANNANSIGHIIVGRNIEGDITSLAGTISNIGAGAVGTWSGDVPDAYQPGKISGTISAYKDIGDVIAFGNPWFADFHPSTANGNGRRPAAGADPALDGKALFQQSLKDGGKPAVPVLRAIPGLPADTDGDILGTITARGSINSVIAYGDISGAISAGGSIGNNAHGGSEWVGVWAAGNVGEMIVAESTEPFLKAGSGFIVVDAWGTLGGKIEAKGDITARAHGDVLAEFDSTNGAVTASSSGSLTADIKHAKTSVDLWAVDRITVSGSSDGNAKFATYGKFNGDFTVGNNLGLVTCKDLDDTTFTTTGGGKVGVLGFGDIDDLTIKSDDPAGLVSSATSIYALGNINSPDIDVDNGAAIVSWEDVTSAVVKAGSGNAIISARGKVNANVETDAEAAVEGGEVAGFYIAGSAKVFSTGNAGDSTDNGDDSTEYANALTIETDEDILLVTPGSIKGTFRSTAGSVDLKAGGDIEGEVKGENDVAITSWGAVDATIESTSGNVTLDAYNAIAGSVEAAESITLVGWGNLDAPLTITGDEPDNGDVSAQVAGSISKAITAKGDATVVSWGEEISGKVSAGAHHAKVTSHGTVSGEVSGPDGVTVDAMHDISGNLTATDGPVTAVAGRDVKSMTITAHGNVTLNAFGQIAETTIDATSNSGTGTVKIASATAADVTVTANADVELLAGTDAKAAVTIGAGYMYKSVKITALETISKAEVTAPDGTVTLFAGGAADPTKPTAENISVGTAEVLDNNPDQVTLSVLGELKTAAVHADDSIEILASGKISDLTATTSETTSRIELLGGDAVSANLESANDLDVFGDGEVAGVFKSGMVNSHLHGDVSVVSRTAIVASPPSSEEEGGEEGGEEGESTQSGTIIQAGAVDGFRSMQSADVSAPSIEAAVSAQGNADVVAADRFEGSVATHYGDVDVSVLAGGISGKIDAGATEPNADANVVASGDIHANIHANHDANVSTLGYIMGDVIIDEDYSIDGDITLYSSGKVYGDIMAKQDATVVAGAEAVGKIEGRDISVFAKGTISGSVTAEENASVMAVDRIMASVTATGLEATVTSLAAVIGNVTAGTEAKVASGGSVEGDVTSYGDATVMAVEQLLGDVETDEDAFITLWDNSVGTISAKENITLRTAGSVLGAVTAGDDPANTQQGDADVVAEGNVAASVTAHRHASVVAGESVSAAVTATGGDASATATGGSVGGTVTGNQNAYVLSLGSVTGNVTATNLDASVVGWTLVKNTVSAGRHANVFSGGQMIATVTSGTAEPGDASVTAHDTATVSVTANGGSADILSVGLLRANVIEATADISVLGFADAVVLVNPAESTVNPVGDVHIDVLGWLAGPITATGNASVIVGSIFTGTITSTAGDAFLLALGDITGSDVSAGGTASVYGFESVADVTVDGDDGAMLFAYDVLYGSVTSDSGWAEAFSGGDAWILGITAATDLAVTTFGDLRLLGTGCPYQKTRPREISRTEGGETRTRNQR